MAKVITPRSNFVRSFNSSSQPPPRSPVSKEPVMTQGNEHSERVLLLEDEAQTNFILREYLESLGYHVVAVANGVDGLREVIKMDFELVICDMMMPKLPGDMFYLAVQKTRPALCNRFVFITGHQQNPAIDAFIERTHSAILVKPFRLQQLEATLEGILSRFPKKLRPVDSTPAPAESAPANLEPRPLRLEERQSYQVPISMAPAKPVKSMVSKIVGLIRGNSQPAPTAPPVQAAPAKITVRVPPDGRKITRRIAHLANAPVVPPPSGSISAINMASSPKMHTTPRVTRRVATPTVLPPTGSLSMSSPAATPVQARVTRRVAAAKDAPEGSMSIPKVTRTVPKAGNLIRVKHTVAPAEDPAKTRVTRKVPSATAAPSATKVTRSIPKVTVRVPKTILKIVPPTPDAEPKVTRKVAAAPKPKVTAKVIPKVSRKVEKPAPAPVVTRRVSGTKKSS